MFVDIAKPHFYSIQELESIAKVVKKKDNKPIIIEVSGTPNAGKTMALSRLETILKRHFSLPTKVIYEAAKLCPIKDKYSPLFDYWTANTTINRLLDSISKGHKLIICERGIFDAISWLTTYSYDKLISKENLQKTTDFYFLSEWAQFLEYLFVMKCSVQTSIQREAVDGLLTSEGTIVNEQTLVKLEKGISIAINNNADKIKNYSILDTSELSQEETNRLFVSSIFNFLSQLP